MLIVLMLFVLGVLLGLVFLEIIIMAVSPRYKPPCKGHSWAWDDKDQLMCTACGRSAKDIIMADKE